MEGRLTGYVAVQRLMVAVIATVVYKHPCTNEVVLHDIIEGR